jgi:hypothetical protein
LSDQHAVLQPMRHLPEVMPGHVPGDRPSVGGIAAGMPADSFGAAPGTSGLTALPSPIAGG